MKGRPYLANVASYSSGASYFRGIHTEAECAEHQAQVVARGNAQAAYEAASRKFNEDGLALVTWIQQAKADGTEPDEINARIDAHWATCPKREDYFKGM